MSTSLIVRSEKNGVVFFDDREYGQLIASAIKSLDPLAMSLNLRTIDSFTYMEPDLLQEMIEHAPPEKKEKFERRLKEQLEWHSPTEGLKTLMALKPSVEDQATIIQFQIRGPNQALRDALVEDLTIVAGILSELEKSSDRFRFEAA